ncbi:hypothetical protein PIIN_05765 [Serendipita indica DSM 11827]|uniref:Uncharacterized protein n=1 Tax=Serendipita indica (strain DSM 11827) TaxID=1109443 RepID=G4TKI2_SERID|nr:hypothetical protein PIIN_05765 [Serendipita indica DSM 11827]
MNHHYRFYPLPRPSLKSANCSSRASRSSSTTANSTPAGGSYNCSCTPPCSSMEACKGSCYSSSMPSSADSSSMPSPTAYPPQPPSPHVHFLNLYQTYIVDYEYDRSPTVVMPNECALPARGCPGKTYFATVARTGRRITRCATPAASRGNSRSRSNMSPPPSPSFYAKHIFYPGKKICCSQRIHPSNKSQSPDEYPFPSPVPSPRVGAARQLATDTPPISDDSDQGLSTPPDMASQAPSPRSLSRRGSATALSNNAMGMQLYIDAPSHPPIPGLSMSPTGRGADMFAITNALNGLELNPGSPTTPKKVKTKKSKSSLSGSPTSEKKRARVVPPAPSWTADQGVLGGF